MQLWLRVWEAEEEGEDWQRGCPWPQTQFCFTKEGMNTELCRARLYAEQPGEDEPQTQDRTKARESCFSLWTGCFCLKYSKRFSSLSSCLHLPSSRLDCSTAVGEKKKKFESVQFILLSCIHFWFSQFASSQLLCQSEYPIPLPPSPKIQPLLIG